MFIKYEDIQMNVCQLALSHSYTYMHARLCVYECMHNYMSIYIYIYIYIHAQTKDNIYIYI